MKNFRYIIIVLACYMLVSCKPEIKEVKGVVKTWKEEIITIKTSDGDKVYHTGQARMIGGMPISGDSVRLNYIIGKNDTDRAVVIEYLAPITKPAIVTPGEKKKDVILKRKVDNSNDKDKEHK